MQSLFSKRTKNKHKNDGRVVQLKFADKITRNAKNHHYYNISVDFSESYYKSFLLTINMLKCYVTGVKQKNDFKIHIWKTF